MRQPVSLLLLLLAAGAAYYFTMSEPPAAMPDTEKGSEPDNQPVTAPPLKIRSDATQTPPKQPPQVQTPDQQRPPARRSKLAEQLDWPEADTVKLRAWHAALVDEQEGLLSELTDGGGPLVAKEFNSRMAKRRATLVEQFGVERANRALARLPVYQINLGAGNWLRVDAQGSPIPFASEDARTRLENYRPVR